VGLKLLSQELLIKFARSSGVLKEKEPNLTGEDIREGIVAIISVRLPQPQFEGQTKGKLGSQEVEGVVNRLFSEALTEFFEKNPIIVKSIAERALRAAKARAAAKRASELKDRIGDAKALTDAFNPDAKFKALTASLSGVAGGFAAAQGAYRFVWC